MYKSMEKHKTNFFPEANYLFCQKSKTHLKKKSLNPSYKNEMVASPQFKMCIDFCMKTKEGWYRFLNGWTFVPLQAIHNAYTYLYAG